MLEQTTCTHVPKKIHKRNISPRNVCEECIKTGDEWVHLRYCLTCGQTLCCDDSPNKHMTKHNHETGHPVIQSAQPAETWTYCYTEKLMMEPGLKLGEKVAKRVATGRAG